MEIETEIREKKYGLLFEEHQEEFELQKGIKLVENENMSIKNEKNDHILIEGENLLILELLKKEYLEKIDLICIDPPYNTRNEKLTYNDSDYSDERDKYSHSKWLSFMNERLLISYNLLSQKGVMFIHIDETQIGGLILLCHQIFGEENVIVLIWPKIDPKYDTNRVEKPLSDVKITHEYVLLCYKNRHNNQLKKMLRRPNCSTFDDNEKFLIIESILNELGTTSSAKDEIEKIFGNRKVFSTPKPIKLIKEIIRAATTKNSLVLDFFAGSGTTGHAVMKLNREDRNERKCILINNNENNICREITIKRLKASIEIENFIEGWKYLQIEK